MNRMPEHMKRQYGDLRGFRQVKRAQIRALHQQLDKLNMGCAYLPCGAAPVDEIRRQLSILSGACSVKEWGR